LTKNVYKSSLRTDWTMLKKLLTQSEKIKTI